MFTRQKKKTLLSLHYSPNKIPESPQTDPISGKLIPVNKPNFLYFTHRQRQNINFFDTQPVFKNLQTECEKQIDQKIGTSFFKTSKLKSKQFDYQSRSLHEENSRSTNRKKFLKLQLKSQSMLKRKAYKYKNEEPCVGMYNAKPENLMKRIAKNEVFRKGKSCHNILSQNKENTQKLYIVNSSIHNKKSDRPHQNSPTSLNASRIFTASASISQKRDDNGKKIHSSFQTSRNKIKCFDMSKQTSRKPFKIISNKIQEVDYDNSYIEKNYKRQIYIPVPMNGQELSGFYQKQKKKYGIQSTCGILKHIKLQDFIKIHRNEVVSEDQNFD